MKWFIPVFAVGLISVPSHAFELFQPEVKTIQLSGDGSLLVGHRDYSYSAEKQQKDWIFAWSTKTGKPINLNAILEGEPVENKDFPNQLVTISNDGQTLLMRHQISPYEIYENVPLHQFQIWDLRSGSAIKTGEFQRKAPRYSVEPNTWAFVKGEWRVVESDAVYFYASDGKLKRKTSFQPPLGSSGAETIISVDGTKIIGQIWDKNVGGCVGVVIDGKTGRIVRRLDYAKDDEIPPFFYFPGLSPNGRYLIATYFFAEGIDPGPFQEHSGKYVWDIYTGRQVKSDFSRGDSGGPLLTDGRVLNGNQIVDLLNGKKLGSLRSPWNAGKVGRYLNTLRVSDNGKVWAEMDHKGNIAVHQARTK